MVKRRWLPVVVYVFKVVSIIRGLVIYAVHNVPLNLVSGESIVTMVIMFFVVLIGIFLIPTPSEEDAEKARKKNIKDREIMLEKLDPETRKKEEEKEKTFENGVMIFWFFVFLLMFIFSAGSCMDNRTLKEEYEDDMRWERTRR